MKTFLVSHSISMCCISEKEVSLLKLLNCPPEQDFMSKASVVHSECILLGTSVSLYDSNLI